MGHDQEAVGARSVSQPALRPVGYWPELGAVGIMHSFWRMMTGEALLPTPHDLVDPDWSPVEREQVLKHLAGGTIRAVWYGWADCRMCEKHNGSRDYTDGVYVWPEGLAHYVRAHNVKPPQEFVNHVLRGGR